MSNRIGHGSDRAVLTFVAITYALSLALSVVIGTTGGQASSLIGFGFLSMAFPTVAVLVVRAAFGERLGIDWGRILWRYVPVALLLVPALMHAVMLPAAMVFEDGLHWQGWLTPESDGFYHVPPDRGWGIVTGPGLAGRIAINAAVGLALVSILALFEEVGWRAWLLPRLVGRLGARAGLTATALIAAGWHMPYVFSGIHYLQGVDAGTTAVVMSVGQVGAGLIIGWLWLRTESIWIVALAHGALNNWGQYAFKYIQDFVSGADWLVLGVGNIALLVCGLVLTLAALPENRAGAVAVPASVASHQ